MYDGGMERQIKVKNKTYTIKLNAASVKAERAVFIENAVKGALELAQVCAEKLSGGGVDTEFAAVFGESGAVAKRRVRDVFCAMPEVFEDVGFLLKKVFVDKNGRSPEVLASADAAANTISLYDAFFAEDSDPENDRPSVLLHEAAHLCGLKSDAESCSPDSAECVRNFALLVSGKMDIDTLLGKGESGESDVDETDSEEDGSSDAGDADGADESGVADGDGGESESDEDEQENGDESERGGEEMPYRPDQLRAPKGQSNGGQWVSEGGGAGGAGTSDGASISQQSHKTQTTNTPEKQPDSASTESTEEKENKDEKPTNSKKTKEEKEKEMEDLLKEMKEVDSDLKDSGITAEFRPYSGKGEFNGSCSDRIDVVEGNEECYEDDPRADSELEHGLWASNDMKLSNLKPNSRYTAVFQVFYEYFDLNGKKCRKKVWVAYDIISDSNGDAIISRIGWLNVNNKKDGIDIFKGVKIDYKVFVCEGAANYNFTVAQKKWHPGGINYGKQRPPHSISDYLEAHATNGSMKNADTKYNPNGRGKQDAGLIIVSGGVYGAVEVASGQMHIKHSGKTKRKKKSLTKRK